MPTSSSSKNTLPSSIPDGWEEAMRRRPDSGDGAMMSPFAVEGGVGVGGSSPASVAGCRRVDSSNSNGSSSQFSHRGVELGTPPPPASFHSDSANSGHEGEEDVTVTGVGGAAVAPLSSARLHHRHRSSFSVDDEQPQHHGGDGDAHSILCFAALAASGVGVRPPVVLGVDERSAPTAAAAANVTTTNNGAIIHRRPLGSANSSMNKQHQQRQFHTEAEEEGLLLKSISLATASALFPSSTLMADEGGDHHSDEPRPSPPLPRHCVSAAEPTTNTPPAVVSVGVLAVGCSNEKEAAMVERRRSGNGPFDDSGTCRDHLLLMGPTHCGGGAVMTAAPTTAPATATTAIVAIDEDPPSPAMPRIGDDVCTAAPSSASTTMPQPPTHVPIPPSAPNASSASIAKRTSRFLSLLPWNIQSDDKTRAAKAEMNVVNGGSYGSLEGEGGDGDGVASMTVTAPIASLGARSSSLAPSAPLPPHPTAAPSAQASANPIKGLIDQLAHTITSKGATLIMGAPQQEDDDDEGEDEHDDGNGDDDGDNSSSASRSSTGTLECGPDGKLRMGHKKNRNRSSIFGPSRLARGGVIRDDGDEYGSDSEMYNTTASPPSLNGTGSFGGSNSDGGDGRRRRRAKRRASSNNNGRRATVGAAGGGSGGGRLSHSRRSISTFGTPSPDRSRGTSAFNEEKEAMRAALREKDRKLRAQRIAALPMITGGAGGTDAMGMMMAENESGAMVMGMPPPHTLAAGVGVGVGGVPLTQDSGLSGTTRGPWQFMRTCERRLFVVSLFASGLVFTAFAIVSVVLTTALYVDLSNCSSLIRGYQIGAPVSFFLICFAYWPWVLFFVLRELPRRLLAGKALSPLATMLSSLCCIGIIFCCVMALIGIIGSGADDSTEESLCGEPYQRTRIISIVFLSFCFVFVAGYMGFYTMLFHRSTMKVAKVKKVKLPNTKNGKKGGTHTATVTVFSSVTPLPKSNVNNNNNSANNVNNSSTNRHSNNSSYAANNNNSGGANEESLHASMSGILPSHPTASMAAFREGGGGRGEADEKEGRHHAMLMDEEANGANAAAVVPPTVSAASASHNVLMSPNASRLLQLTVPQNTTMNSSNSNSNCQRTTAAGGGGGGGGGFGASTSGGENSASATTMAGLRGGPNNASSSSSSAAIMSRNSNAPSAPSVFVPSSRFTGFRTEKPVVRKVTTAAATATANVSTAGTIGASPYTAVGGVGVGGRHRGGGRVRSPQSMGGGNGLNSPASSSSESASMQRR